MLGVSSVVEPHRPIPNSEVKRNSGEDTLGVAPRDNSSMPSFSFSSIFLSLALPSRRAFFLSAYFSLLTYVPSNGDAQNQKC
jgi:hypothetical protein